MRSRMLLILLSIFSKNPFSQHSSPTCPSIFPLSYYPLLLEIRWKEGEGDSKETRLPEYLMKPSHVIAPTTVNRVRNTGRNETLNAVRRAKAVSLPGREGFNKSEVGR